MKPRVVRAGLVILGAGAVLVGGLAFRPPAVEPVAVTQGPRVPLHADTLARVARLAQWRAMVAQDPFRRARTPADRAYDAQALEAAKQAAAAPPPAPRPVLSLSGILFGPRPAAILEGVPGADGARLLHVGDTAVGLRVRAITRTHTIITGFDTTWTLTIREPWR